MIRWLCLTALCLLLSACQHAPAQRSTTAAGARKASPASPLPSGWPLTWLSLPPGAVRAPLDLVAPAQFGDAYTISGLPFNAGSPEEGRLWRCGFAFPAGLAAGDFAGAQAFIEETVTPRGYYLYFNEDTPQREGREYISPDGKYIVQLYHFRASGNFHLQVSEYTKAWYPTTKVEPPAEG